MIREYRCEYKQSLIEFMEICLPETGRVFELNGRHKMYQDVKDYYETFWCLLDDDKVIGTVGVKKIDDTKCELKALFLLQKYQGKGLGYKLAMRAIHEAKKKYKEMYLDTMATSKKAISLYKRLGFIETNRYNDNQVADIFMVLDLTRKTMEYQLTNDFLTVSIKSAGAEITSIKAKDGLEYIWCGDAKYWGRHAPVLFPIVGKVIENQYTYEGRTFNLSQHGFARDCEFEVESIAENAITFVLESNAQTKEKYPFEFTLKLHYKLIDCKIVIGYEVINQDTKEMYFSIGGHPAFNCPMYEDETMEDYVIEFEVAEEAKKLGITPEVYLSGEVEDYKVKTISLSHDFFKEGVTILKELQSQKVTLKSLKHGSSITISRGELPFLGLWSPEKGAPFVCIEPWVGHTDYVTSSMDIREKKDFVRLSAGDTFKCQYEMRFDK